MKSARINKNETKPSSIKESLVFKEILVKLKPVCFSLLPSPLVLL